MFEENSDEEITCLSRCHYFEKFRRSVFRPHKFLRLRSVSEKLRFRDGLVWRVSLTVEIKLRFRDGLVWRVSLTVEITLRFRDGLVWRVSLTVEIKLCFRISPFQC